MKISICIYVFDKYTYFKKQTRVCMSHIQDGYSYFINNLYIYTMNFWRYAFARSYSCLEDCKDLPEVIGSEMSSLCLVQGSKCLLLGCVDSDVYLWWGFYGFRNLVCSIVPSISVQSGSKIVLGCTHIISGNLHKCVFSLGTTIAVNFCVEWHYRSVCLPNLYFSVLKRTR